MKIYFASLLLVFSGGTHAITCSTTQPDGTVGPATSAGVVPEYCANWISGDAGQECVVNLGYEFGLKLDSPAQPEDSVSGACDGQGSCSLAPEFDNTVVISENDGQHFFFSANPFPLGAVVVKGGPYANVFTYDPPAFEDGVLYAPLNPNNTVPFDISHISFCWGDQTTTGCYEEETAWAVGAFYNANGRGNWAMYVDYLACGSFPCDYLLRADGGDGVGIIVGRATLNPNGDGTATISINLEGGAIFYYDLADTELDDNLKVQPYEEVAPSGNPKVGQFAYKLSVPVGSTTAAIVVPLAQYYGIHLDVAVPVTCN